MSCFESSTFLKNPQIMRRDLLVKACDQLGWSYVQEGNTLTVISLNNETRLHGEYALKLEGNRVTYNSYYLKNGKELVGDLKQAFWGLNVKYARQSILQAFESKGFKFKKDRSFQATQEVADQFYMVGYSKLTNESEKRTEIKFSILRDGTIVSDSNYIPEDIHELADEAMAEIDQAFGSERKEGQEIIRKKIPLKYKHKAYCSADNKIKAKY
jgi:hypothetical protein